MVKRLREMMAGEAPTIAEETLVTAGGTSTILCSCGWATNIQGVLQVTAKPGSYTDETLDVVIYNYDPVSGAEDEVVTFTQVTNPSIPYTDWKYESTNKRLGNWIRVKWTVGGTSPSYSFNVRAHLKKQ
jgi:hypothetical protein